MSFVDSLRTPNAAPLDTDKQWLELCSSAIQQACLEAKHQGFRSVKGFIYWDRDGYDGRLTGVITPTLPQKLARSDLSEKFSSLGSRSLYDGARHYLFSFSPQFESRLRDEIRRLGFTNFRVSVAALEDETETISRGWASKNVKYQKNGKVGKSVYVELNW